MRDNTDVVAGVKAELERARVPLTGPGGAWEITRRVAWALRAEGAGLLVKTSGNNWQGQSVDVVCYPDGTWVDCLINAETENRPAWQVGSSKVDPARWVAPTEPEALPAPGGPPDSPGVSDDSDMERLIRTGEMIVDALEELHGAVQALDTRIIELRKDGIRLRV